jgi:hypothetical protein
MQLDPMSTENDRPGALPVGYSLEQDGDGDWVLMGPPDVILYSEPGEGRLIGKCDEATALADALEHLASQPSQSMTP